MAAKKRAKKSAADKTPALEVNASRQFTAWLAEQRAGLAFTTYQAGKVFFVGLKPDGSLSLFERTLERCMGMTAVGDSLHISTLYQLWRFENFLELVGLSGTSNTVTVTGGATDAVTADLSGLGFSMSTGGGFNSFTDADGNQLDVAIGIDITGVLI